MPKTSSNTVANALSVMAVLTLQFFAMQNGIAQDINPLVESITGSREIKSSADGKSFEIPLYLTSSVMTGGKGLLYAPFGDWDAVQMEQEASGSKEKEPILFSIESLDLKRPFIWSKRLPVSDDPFRRGYLVSVPKNLVKKQEALPLGIFVCRDTAKNGSCRGKPFEDVQLIIERYVLPAEAKKRVVVPPKESLYFFGLLVVNDKRIYSYTGGSGVPEHMSKLSLLYGQAITPSTKDEVNKFASERISLLRSAPPLIQRPPGPSPALIGAQKIDPVVVIDLPHKTTNRGSYAAMEEKKK